MDAIRYGFLVGGGASGLAALYIAVRRQRSAEIALLHTNHDATQRRSNELFSTSVEQLANESRAIRRGGLISLERLGQENAAFRQSVIDVLCAYLRTPFRPPLNVLPHRDDGSDDPRELIEIAPLENGEDDSGLEEYELRMDIQETLRRHLRISDELIGQYPLPDDLTPSHNFWRDMDLNLDRATLVKFNLDGCRINSASFVDTRFLATTMIRSAVFQGSANFGGSQFARDAWFANSRFSHTAQFANTKFSHFASFERARFEEPVTFINAEFTQDVDFSNATLTLPLYFARAHFWSDANFEGLSILDEGHHSFGPWNNGFTRAVIRGDADLSSFAKDPSIEFLGCKVWPQKVTGIPPGWNIIDNGDNGDSSNADEPSHRLVRSDADESS